MSFRIQIERRLLAVVYCHFEHIMTQSVAIVHGHLGPSMTLGFESLPPFQINHCMLYTMVIFLFARRVLPDDCLKNRFKSSIFRNYFRGTVFPSARSLVAPWNIICNIAVIQLMPATFGDFHLLFSVLIHIVVVLRHSPSFQSSSK